MYELGLTPERIARVCRVRVQAVRRVTEARDRKDPAFAARRLVVHDQPALPRQRPLLSWYQQYENLRWFVDTMGRLPRQDGSTWERHCHGFLYQQRHKHHAGMLSTEQIALLDRIDGWYIAPRPPDHWRRRFDDYLRFTEHHSHRPRETAAQGTDERSLMIWMLSQRRRLRSGTMPASRNTLLNRSIPGWQGQSSAPGNQPLAAL